MEDYDVGGNDGDGNKNDSAIEVHHIFNLVKQKIDYIGVKNINFSIPRLCLRDSI